MRIRGLQGDIFPSSLHVIINYYRTLKKCENSVWNRTKIAHLCRTLEDTIDSTVGSTPTVFTVNMENAYFNQRGMSKYGKLAPRMAQNRVVLILSLTKACDFKLVHWRRNEGRKALLAWIVAPQDLSSFLNLYLPHIRHRGGYCHWSEAPGKCIASRLLLLRQTIIAWGEYVHGAHIC